MSHTARSSLLILSLLALSASCGDKGDSGEPPTRDSSGSPGGDSGRAGDTGLATEEGTGGLGDNGGLDTDLETFECGDKTCISTYEYCYAVTSGIGGDTDYSCELVPEACLPEPDCGCLVTAGAIDATLERCTEDKGGHLFVELTLP